MCVAVFFIFRDRMTLLKLEQEILDFIGNNE